MDAQNSRFNWVELLVVAAVLVILAGLLLPAALSTRVPSQRTICINNIKQLGIALANYASYHGSFPPRRGGRGFDDVNSLIGDGRVNNQGDLSAFIPLLPFLEETPLYDQIMNGQPRGGPTPDPTLNPHFAPYRKQIESLICPSDEAIGEKRDDEYGRSSYVFNVGDAVAGSDAGANPRGVFGLNSKIGLPDLADGASNTMFMSERAFGVSPRDVRGGGTTGWKSGTLGQAGGAMACQTANGGRLKLAGSARGFTSDSGHNWANGRAIYSAISTILPPNAPLCVEATSQGPHGIASNDGIFTASSYHSGGVVALFGDGSTKFVTDTIDTGDLKAANVQQGPSPYGVWGAFGTRDGEPPPPPDPRAKELPTP